MFRKIGIVFTAVLLIAATGGYSIYRNYCDCQDLTTTSVFLESACEHDQIVTEVPSCCSVEKKEMSCCSSGNHDTGNHACHTGSCCHTVVQFLKINDSYTAGQVKISLEVVSFVIDLFEKEILFDGNTSFEPSGIFFSDSSPPISGKQRLLEIHQLKLSPAVLG